MSDTPTDKKRHDDVTNPAHWAGFVISGGIAFVIDATVTKSLNVMLGVPLLGSRLVGISLAMVGGWLAHRRFTFALATTPTPAEFVKYAGVAWTSAAVNYAIFAAIIFLTPSIEPLIAIAIASAFAMVVSYLGMRFAAFRATPPK